MTTIQEEYPQIVKKIEQKQVSSNEIDIFFINLIENQLKEINEGKKEELDIGDIFSIYTLAINRGYFFNKNLEELIIKLGDYQLKENGKYTTDLNTLEDVKRLLEKIKSLI